MNRHYYSTILLALLSVAGLGLSPVILLLTQQEAAAQASSRALQMLCPEGSTLRGNTCVMEPEPICRNGGEEGEQATGNRDIGGICVKEVSRDSEGNCDPENTVYQPPGENVCYVRVGEVEPGCTEKGFRLQDGECSKQLKPQDVRQALSKQLNRR